jgi:single stranded DNA-binding protein
MINVNIIGRLGQDAEIKEGKNGQFVKFTLATTTDTHKDESGKYPTTWINVIYGNANQNFVKTLTKGRLVNVIGQLTASTYTSKDGSVKVSLDVRAHNVDYVSNGNSNPQAEDVVTTGASPKEITKESLEKAVKSSKSKVEPKADDVEDTDDLPF